MTDNEQWAADEDVGFGPPHPSIFTIDGYDLDLTCWACPEQYDVHKDGETVGYLRLRHGQFRAEWPDCGGEIVYTAATKGDGQFYDDERARHLRAAVTAIRNRVEGLDVCPHCGRS